MNSYRRLWDTGFWAPVFADWGYQNRTCALRISAPGRFEYRSVDSMVNPYLMGSALLKAFEDGIDNDIDPGEPEERNIYEAMEAGKLVKKLPMSLGEALDQIGRRRGHSGIACPTRCSRFSCTTSETSGSDSTTRSPNGISIPIWTACPEFCLEVSDANSEPWRIWMCGIAGLIHKGKSANIGGELTAMLQSLKHRGPDSTGFALYGNPMVDKFVMRFKVAEQEDVTKGFDIHHQMKERKSKVDDRMSEMGARRSNRRNRSPTTPIRIPSASPVT